MPRPTQPFVQALSNTNQTLRLQAATGGSVAAWCINQLPWMTTPFEAPIDIWRPTHNPAHNAISLASMPMVPWCNRISRGGIQTPEGFCPLTPNLPGEIYPIHGDGFLQSWEWVQADATQATMQLTSNRYLGNPHHYAATQIVELTPDGMVQTLQLTHLGQHPLPYGMGQHPWFVNTTATRVQADVTGMWLCDSQYLPTQHTSKFDADKDLNLSISTKGSLINNLYDGWSGHASIDYPLYGLKLLLHAELNVCGANKPCFLMVYRPENSEVFCLEPVSHTVDAFHQTEQTGLHWLSHNESMSLTLTWRFTPLY